MAVAKIVGPSSTISPPLTASHLTTSKGGLDGRPVSQTRSAKIQFEKMFLSKDEAATEKMIGAIAITQDNNHKGWLHVLIFIGQLFSAVIQGKSRENINLCHSEVVIGINSSDKRKGDLLLAHAIFGGIKTTSESHKKDEVITGIALYRPVDEKMKDLFTQFALQTAVDFRTAGLDPKKPDFKTRVKKEVPQFSIAGLASSLFHRQVLKPTEQVQKKAAYAAADLLLGDKFRDEKGNLASYYCTGYVMTLTQGTALVSALSDDEQKSLKEMSRDEIAQKLLARIQEKKAGDYVAATYWENDFMQLDARNTMSYTAADTLNQASAV